MNDNVKYKKLPKNFPAVKLKKLIDQTLPGKTLEQCQNIIKHSSIVGAFDGDKLIGIGRALDDTVYSFVTDIMVHPDYRKIGIGTKIVRELCDYLIKKDVKIIHCSTEKDLINFYKSAGFKYHKNDITLYLKA